MSGIHHLACHQGETGFISGPGVPKPDPGPEDDQSEEQEQEQGPALAFGAVHDK